MEVELRISGSRQDRHAETYLVWRYAHPNRSH